MAHETRPTWLLIKRLKAWSPLAAVRPMLAPMAPGELAAGQPAPDPSATV